MYVYLWHVIRPGGSCIYGPGQKYHLFLNTRTRFVHRIIPSQSKHAAACEAAAMKKSGHKDMRVCRVLMLLSVRTVWLLEKFICGCMYTRTDQLTK